MRVWVTGATGFLGRAVVRTLVGRGHEVVPGRPRGEVDIRRPLPAVDVDAVCHLAALTAVRDSFADPAGYFDTNVGGTVNVLRAVAGRPVRFVLASTGAVYGSARPGRLREDMAPQPENPYAASKVAAEELVRYEAAAGHVGGMVLRLFNLSGAVDGYGDPDTTRIIPACLRAAAGVIPHVGLNGDGSAVREFVHVLDAAEAVRLAVEGAEVGRFEVFNVGTGVGVSMAEVVAAAERVTGRPVPVVRRPPAPEAHTLVSDGAAIGDRLGWKPEVSQIDAILADAWLALRQTLMINDGAAPSGK
jgi:UDP-glucose 4-epimerase